jgi:hypothetical protein
MKEPELKMALENIIRKSKLGTDLIDQKLARKAEEDLIKIVPEMQMMDKKFKLLNN